MQHGERGFQAVSQVIEGVAVSRTLFTLTVQQAVEGAGKAQQFAWVLFGQAFAGAAFDLVKLLTQPPQGLKAQVRPSHSNVSSTSNAAPKPK